MGLASWIRENIYPNGSIATSSARSQAVANMFNNAYAEAEADLDRIPNSDWYDEGIDTGWKAAMAEATRAQQLKAAGYSDYAARGTMNWNIGSNSTQPIPKMGDVITTDGIMALVRHEMEKGVAKAVVKCQHCGMWAARFCACGKCGAPVD